MSENPPFDRDLHRLERLGDAGYFVALHVRLTSPMTTYQSYSDEWKNHYRDAGYALRDPLTAWAFGNTGATRWSDPQIIDTYGVLADARAFGLNYGAVASTGPIVSRSFVTLARGDRELTGRELGEVLKAIESLHSQTEPPGTLTPAQIEALRLIAGGDRYDAAASRLGISVSALKARLTAARKRLMARTTGEAIQRAKDYGLF